jgi:hypothetical protein
MNTAELVCGPTQPTVKDALMQRVSFNSTNKSALLSSLTPSLFTICRRTYRWIQLPNWTKDWCFRSSSSSSQIRSSIRLPEILCVFEQHGPTGIGLSNRRSLQRRNSTLWCPRKCSRMVRITILVILMPNQSILQIDLIWNGWMREIC